MFRFFFVISVVATMEDEVDGALLRFEPVLSPRHVLQLLQYILKPLILSSMVRWLLQVLHSDCKLGTVLFGRWLTMLSIAGVMAVVVLVHLE